MAIRREKLTLVALCAGHFVNDSYSSIVFPLLPLLKAKLGLSTTQIFWLAPLYAISSSLMQPIYGFISDRYARRFFAVFGPAITGLFVSMVGLAPSYGVLILILMGAGFGIGAFHPQAAAMVTNAATERKRMALALFSATGTVGFAIGPISIALLTDRFGLNKTYYVVAAGFLISAFMYRVCPPLAEPRRAKAVGERLLDALRPVWKPLLFLYVITVIRSAMQITSNNYLPFFLGERGYGLTETGSVMTVFLLLGGLGGLAGGLMAERVSGRAVTLYSGILSGPLMIGAFLTSGPLSIVLLALGGFMLLSTLPVNVSMAQELAPGQTSTVSALMMGAAWGLGALAPPLLDNLVPAYGFRTVLVLASAMTMLSAIFAYMLPREEPHRLVVVEAELATVTPAGD